MSFLEKFDFSQVKAEILFKSELEALIERFITPIYFFHSVYLCETPRAL